MMLVQTPSVVWTMVGRVRRSGDGDHREPSLPLPQHSEMMISVCSPHVSSPISAGGQRRLERWAGNPWRRLSLRVIGLLVGFRRDSITTVAGAWGKWTCCSSGGGDRQRIDRASATPSRPRPLTGCSRSRHESDRLVLWPVSRGLQADLIGRSLTPTNQDLRQPRTNCSKA